jgi:hypothetical protein
MKMSLVLAVLMVLAVGLFSTTFATASEARAGTVKSSPAPVVTAIPAKPQHKRLTAPPGSTRYTCTTENHHTECVCKGVLDCNDMIKSGDCKGQDIWEGDDPSVGGCG